MIVFFAGILAASVILSLPVWFAARSRQQAAWWLPFLGGPAIFTWVALAALGVGPQSLSNIIEVMALAVMSVLVCYAQVFVLNRRFSHTGRTSACLALSLSGVALLLRLFMPLVPE